MERRGRVWHHAHGIVCCGDAGGLVDPLWGEGITAAFELGRAAGEAIAAYLRGNNKALPDYSKWVSQHFAARYGETSERRSLAALTGIGPVQSDGVRTAEVGLVQEKQHQERVSNKKHDSRIRTTRLLWRVKRIGDRPWISRMSSPFYRH